ncbi:MAG: DUF4411 family protein [Spirochaetaceae bacterium]|nr:DUF4411 family protein [Spirochaetaceae bacterium]MDT8297884.1 DUF4411 family protein [Spirochaetaceae bacterium]
MSFSYLLDANIFIQAHRERYPFDVFPIFWEWLESENEKGTITSIDPVYKELNPPSGTDELSAWTKTLNKSQWFLPVDDEACQISFAEIANWTYRHPTYKQTAKDEFLDIADSLIIAKAKSMGITVVTQEKSSPNSRNRIQIPDVCREFDVPCINLLQLIRTLEARFQ